MPPKIALIGCILITIWLLVNEKKRNPKSSIALWVPTLWLLIMGSRPVALWTSYSASGISDQEGSFLDRIVLNVLTLFALFILFNRNIIWEPIIKDNYWLILLYIFLIVSVFWSDYPFSSFKRWLKITETIVMAFVILTERNPLDALESVIRRCSYILVPLSIVLIKYFPDYGVQYSEWEGVRMGTGVTTHKNSLGVLCAIISLVLIWSFIRTWRSSEHFQKRSQVVADILVIGIGIFLLFGGGGTYSATSIFIFYVGITILLVFYKFKNLAGVVTNNLKVLLIISVMLYWIISSSIMPNISTMMGRDKSLSGRDEIWNSVLEVASQNAVFGVGYGGYWGLKKGAYSKHHEVKQSHSGYLDVYLQVGIVGVIILVMFFFNFCSKVKRGLFYVFDMGVLGVSFLVMVLLYNYSEAGFIDANFIWTVTVFLTVVLSAPYLHTKEIDNASSFKKTNVYYIQAK